MSAPTSRLLFVAALALVPLCALAAFWPSPAAAGIAALAGFCAYDLFEGLRLLRALTIAVPASTKWFEGQPSQLPFEIGNRAARAQNVLITLALPGETREPMSYSVAARSTLSHALASATPPARGRFLLVKAEVRIASPWGLWHCQTILPIAGEIRVYPDLRQDRVSLLLARQPNGAQRQRQLGKGREFEKLRDYTQGDSFDEIHWAATARHGRPIVKVTRIERTQQVYAVLDASRLSARDGVLDRFVHAALALALAAEAQGDRFGLVVFSDRVDAFVPAASGSGHFARCREAIYTVQPRRVSPAFEELFSFLHLRLRTRSLLLFLTALDDPLLAEMFLKSLPIVARRHLMKVSVPKLPHARELFTGGEPATSGEVYRHLAGHLEWARLRALTSTLQHAGVRLSSIDPADATAALARQYFYAKQRQLV